MNQFNSVSDILNSEKGAPIRKALLMKADRVDIERLNDLKSNKQDTDMMLSCQQMICKHFKQLLVLFIEVVNFQVAKANDTKQGIEARKAALISHIQNLAGWVMKFDPINFIKTMEMTVEDEE